MRHRCLAAILVGTALIWAPQRSVAEENGKGKAAELESASKAALQDLYASAPLAKELGPKARAILMFPKVTKAGFGIGGQHGEGALLEKGTAAGYYKTTGASVGLQIGGQTYGYAMFFMNAEALEQLNKADGFEVGVGPSVVVVDEGKAKTMSTTTMKEDVYAFVFGQKGIMAGVGIQGNKISRFTPK